MHRVSSGVARVRTFSLPKSENVDPGVQIVLTVADVDAFRPDPAVEVVTPFEDTHWGTKERVVRDPDGHTWSLQAPGKSSE